MLTNNKNIHALFVNTGVITMELCPGNGLTCIYAKNGKCTADKPKMMCIEALIITAMVEDD